MTEVYWTARAREDVLDIYLAVAIENERAAKAILDRLRARVETISAHPRAGPRRDDIRKGMRMSVERPYLVFYRLTPDDVEEPPARVDIVRVIDGRRDLVRLL